MVTITYVIQRKQVGVSNHFTSFFFLLSCHFWVNLIWISVSSFSPWSLLPCTSPSSAGAKKNQGHDNLCFVLEWLLSILMVAVLVIRIFSSQYWQVVGLHCLNFVVRHGHDLFWLRWCVSLPGVTLPASAWFLLPHAMLWFIKETCVKMDLWASLVAQWLRICLPMQGTRVRALVWEDPACRGATGPVSHNCWACASGACAPQQERPR